MKTTKVTWMFVLLAFLICGNPLQAGNDRTSKDDSDRSSIRNINKQIKKDAKDYGKRGYYPELGAPGIEWQLRRSYEMEYAEDENGDNLYIIGVGSAISDIQNVARRHAVSDAGIDACTMLESKIIGLIENDYNNKLYSREEFQTLSRMKGVFSNLLAQKLPVGKPVCTFVKDNGKYYDYQVRIAYSTKAIVEQTKNVYRDVLGKENDELRKKLERISGFDRLGLPGSGE